MKCLPLLLLPVAFVAVSHARYYCGNATFCPYRKCEMWAFSGHYNITLNLSIASPAVRLVTPLVDPGTCIDPPRRCSDRRDRSGPYCCDNDADCMELQNELIARYKPKPEINAYFPSSITCSSPVVEIINSRGDEISIYNTPCKGDVCSTKMDSGDSDYGNILIHCYMKHENPCMPYGFENGCAYPDKNSSSAVCCCSSRDYCAGYVPTYDTFGADFSTWRWPAAARPDTIPCHEEAGLTGTHPWKTSAPRTCDGGACASIGYKQGGVLKSTYGCVDKMQCWRLFRDNYFSGCGVLYHQTGRGWLCCCSNGDYCNFDQYGSTASAWFLPNLTSPLSPLSPIADLVKSVLTPARRQPVSFGRDGERLSPKNHLSPVENPPTTTTTTTTTTLPTTTTTTTTTSLAATTAPPQPATDSALAAAASGCSVAALLVVAAAV